MIIEELLLSDLNDFNIEYELYYGERYELVRIINIQYEPNRSLYRVFLEVIPCL